MFKRMLAAVDDSARSRLVMQAGRMLAEQSGGALVALRVRPDELDRDLVTEEDLALAQQADDLRAEGIAAHYLTHVGSPERQILQTAERQRSTLIIIAARLAGPRMTPRHRMTVRLAEQAPAPVLVIPETEAQAGKDADLFGAEGAPILVALDGSPRAEQALPYAAELAALLRRPLALLHVALPLTPQERLAAAWSYVEDARRRVRNNLSRDLPVDVQVVSGAPVDETLWAVEGRRAGALVLTAHGQQETARGRASVITLKILRKLRVPALVISSPTLANGAQPPEHAADDLSGAEQ